MAVRRFNWKLLIVIVIGFAVLASTAFSLRTWQKSRMAAGHLADGSNAYASGQWRQAASELGKYIAVAGGTDVPVLLKYADAQLNIRPVKRDNIQQAILTYRAILRIQPDNYEAVTRLIKLYVEMDQFGEAALIAREKLKNSQDPNIQRMLVVSLKGQREIEAAAAELGAMIKSHPDDILAYEALSRLCDRHSKQFGGANAQFWLDEAVRKNSSSAMAYIVRGAFEVRKKRTSQAIKDFEQAQKQDLSQTDVRLRLARELINAGLLSDANQHLAEIQKARPKNDELWQTWATWASKSGNKFEMLKIADAGMKELGSSNLDFMSSAAELYINGGDYDAAGKCIETLRRQDIAPATVAFLRGMLAQSQGHGFEAARYYRESLESDNRNPRVRMMLAELLSDLGDELSAVRQMRLLASEQPDFEEARVYLARLLLHSGRADEAAQEAMDLLRDVPDSADAGAIYAQALIQLFDAGKTGLAPQIEEKLNELEASSPGRIMPLRLRFQFALCGENFDKAARLLAKMQKIAPGDLETAFAEVDLLAAQRKTDEAQKRMAEMLLKFPDSFTAVRYAVRTLDAADRHGECCSMLTGAIGRTKDAGRQRQLSLLLAHELSLNGKPDEARNVLNSLNKRFENDITVKRELLTFESAANNISAVQKLIDEIKAFEGRDGTVWRYEQARAWFEGGNFKKHVSETVSLLKDNLRSDPEDNESQLLLAMTYDKAGLPRQAISAYRDALSRSPQDLRIIIPAVAAMYRSGEYDEADKIMKSAAEQNISHPILSGYELQNYLRLGRLNSAADILDDLLAADPNNDSLNLYLAMIKMRQNHLDEAAELLTTLKDHRQDSLAVFAAIAELNIRQNKTAEAISVCNEAVQKIKTAQAYVLRGRTCDLLGKTSLAQQDFEHAAQLDPNDGQVRAAQARFYADRGRDTEAAAVWEKCIVLSPDNPQIREQSLAFFFGSGNKNMNLRGRKILEDMLAANPQDYRLQIWQARTLLLDKTAPAVDAAINILTKVTAEHPADIDGWTLLYDARIQKNDQAKALDTVLRGLVFLPENRTLLLLKARIEAAHTPELAIPTVKLLHEKDPNDADIAIYLAGLYRQCGDCKAAMSVLDRQLPPGNAAAAQKINVERALTLHKSGDTAQAHKLLASLAQNDPNNTFVPLAEANILKDEQKWDELAEYICRWHRNHRESANTVITVLESLSADPGNDAKNAGERILRSAVAVDQNSPQLINELARLLYVSGRSSEAAGQYRRLLEIDPGNLTATNNLAWIMCENMGNPPKALELAQNGLSISPDYLDLVDTRGIAYFRLGNLDKAIEDFARCAKLYPVNAPAASAVYFHLGRAFAATAKKHDAVEYLKMALESNQKIGGLSANDVAETRDLLDALLKG